MSLCISTLRQTHSSASGSHNNFSSESTRVIGQVVVRRLVLDFFSPEETMSEACVVQEGDSLVGWTKWTDLCKKASSSLHVDTYAHKMDLDWNQKLWVKKAH